MDEVFIYLAKAYGLPIIGEGKLPNKADSVKLRELQTWLGRLVSEHDKLADQVDPSRRLVGKRGRKSGETSSPVKTAADVIARLS